MNNFIKIENKKVTINIKPAMTPVKDVLKMQGRYKHLNASMINYIQKKVKKEWETINSGKFWESNDY